MCGNEGCVHTPFSFHSLGSVSIIISNVYYSHIISKEEDNTSGEQIQCLRGKAADFKNPT